MNRRFFFTTGTIGAFALFVAVNTVDVQAQRGAGIGHAAAPANLGQGRPTTAGRPDTAGRPAGVTTGKPITTSGKPDSTGRPIIADQLSRNQNLATQLQKLFPEGTNLAEASDGFKNLGQFVAAAHVADNNPDFTFEELKAKMFPGAGEGVTLNEEGEGMTLGEAIHALDPNADAEMEVETAQTQAAADLKAAGKKK